MDNITKAHYKYVRQNLKNMSDDLRCVVKVLFKERASYIIASKKTENYGVQAFAEGKVSGLETALSELGIDIKRYGG